MSEWIKCSERLPEEQIEVLVWYEGTGMVPGSIGIDHLAKDRFENGAPLTWYLAGDTVTHWMPLPEPPNENASVNKKEKGE